MNCKEFEMVVGTLTFENERLQKLNDDLMNRIMAGNYTNYKMFEHQEVRDAALEVEFDPNNDPDNAGTIFTDEE